jgi:hypothetical protein
MYSLFLDTKEIPHDIPFPKKIPKRENERVNNE